MGTINNIFNIRINAVSSAASVNFGNTINIGSESNTKAVGGANNIGDLARSLDNERNLYIDPDVADQTRTGLT